MTKVAGVNRVEVTLDDTTTRRLKYCASWRKVPVPGLVRAYVEDWLDVDVEEAMEPLALRNSMYRDHKMSIEERLNDRRGTTST